MKPTKAVNCSNCHFAEVDKGSKYKEATCRRYPPRGMGYQPKVNAECVCGEWTPVAPKAKK